MKVFVSQAAWDDLNAMAMWIARDSPTTALRIYDELAEAALDIGAGPRRFAIMEGFEELEIRQRIKHNHRILFRIEGDVTTVIRIVHGARDLQRILGDG